LGFGKSGSVLAIEGRRRRRTAVTQQAVERALGKLLTDENFRDRFIANPEIACWEAGCTLSPIELEALSRISHEALARFSEDLDKRISRPSLDPDRREAGKAERT
jgi:Ribosomally synthesized peptide prototyped by Frankia Franean1_4349.